MNTKYLLDYEEYEYELYKQKKFDEYLDRCFINNEENKQFEQHQLCVNPNSL